MSVDKDVTEKVIEVLEDGKEGFAHAAEKLADTTRSDLAAKFTSYSTQRAGFSAELERLAAAYGDDIDESGSAMAAVHRTWMSVKDALSGDDPDGVLDAAVQGEDKAVETYEDALAQDISANLRTMLEQQLVAVSTARADVMVLRNIED